MPEEPAYQEGEFEHALSHSAGSSSDLYSSRAEDEPAAASYAGSELVSGFSGLLRSRELWAAATPLCCWGGVWSSLPLQWHLNNRLIFVQAYGHNRAPSFAGSKGGRKDALGILLR